MGKLNCLECSRKKQKCNRQRPQCHGCQISNVPCKYAQNTVPPTATKCTTEAEKVFLDQQTEQLDASNHYDWAMLSEDPSMKPSPDILNLYLDALIDAGGEAAEAHVLEMTTKLSLVSPTALVLAKETSIMLKYCIRGIGFDFLGNPEVAKLCLEKALHYLHDTLGDPSVTNVRAMLDEGLAYYSIAVKMAKDIGINREESLDRLTTSEFEKEECRKLWWWIYRIDQYLRFKNKSVLNDGDNGVFLPGSNRAKGQDQTPYLGMSILASSEWFTPPLEDQSIHSCKILLTRILGKAIEFNHLYHSKGSKINANYIRQTLEGSLQLWWENLPPSFYDHLKLLHSGAKISQSESWQVFEIYLHYNYVRAEVLLPTLFTELQALQTGSTPKTVVKLSNIAKESAMMLKLMLQSNAAYLYKSPIFVIPIFHLAIPIYCATLADIPQDLKLELENALALHINCIREYLGKSTIKPLMLDTFDYLIALTDVKTLVQDFTKLKILNNDPCAIQSN
ncbi:Transcriptional activator [Terramyces sp. JEL0728]|nr:Transcriptional activator [Terramyces sp. JEL0728]